MPKITGKRTKKSPNQQKEIDYKDQNRNKHKRNETIVKVNKAKSGSLRR